MKSGSKLMAILALAFLAGCNAVYTSTPMGESVVQLSEDEWQGTWLHHEIVLTTTVRDAESGRLQAAWVERDADGAKLEVFEGTVRASGDWVFANLEEQGDDGKSRYLWLRIDKSPGRFTAWTPDIERFRAMVEEEKLPGVVDEDNNVTLGEIGPEHLEMINDPATRLLDWEDPDVFYRVGD
jgi:hypothetical protein